MDKELDIKFACLERAIDAHCGHIIDANGNRISDADKIVEAAKKFEVYVNGEKNV